MEGCKTRPNHVARAQGTKDEHGPVARLLCHPSTPAGAPFNHSPTPTEEDGKDDDDDDDVCVQVGGGRERELTTVYS